MSEGSKKRERERERGKKESGDGKAVHVLITIRTGRNHPRPRLEKGLLKLIEGHS